MDIPRTFGIRRRVKVSLRASYGVTALGKQKAEEFALSGPRWEVLAYLAEEGPSSISEIEKQVGMSGDKVKLILRQLISSSYVQRVTQDD